ncbi:hypothetical protein DRQ33_08760, partial [bacterium]
VNFSFNWWISNVNETYDWGPCHTEMEDGTPSGDLNKYKVMSNGEFDYDQTNLPDSVDSPYWQGCPAPDDQSWIDNLANGYDTRFLISFGPLDIPADSAVHMTIAFLVGEDFHQNPQNEEGPSWSPDEFNFDDLGYAAYWIALIFDNPGVDTDSNGYAGDFYLVGDDDTARTSGDGVPDYQGPAPPPAPDIKVETGENSITIYWTGEDIEDVKDKITGIYDFEGYRIHIAEANLDQYFVPLKQFDKVDFLQYDRIVVMENEEGDSVFTGIYNDDAVYDDSLYSVEIVTSANEHIRDSVDLVPEPISYNMGMPPTVEKQFEGDDTMKTYYYYTIENLLPGDDKYVVVTSFDYGQPSRALEELESSRTKYARWIVPAGASIADNKVRVVPNPYRVDHDYSKYWEYSYTGTWSEYSRKLRFFNLPARCIIRIFTLDGDLVQTLHHDDDADGSMVGAEDWNLVSRNDQSIASGIYIFSVEDKTGGEDQIGKFVIIK